MRHTRYLVLALLAACAPAPRPFALRPVMTQDTDTNPVSLPCKPDPSAKDPKRMRCAPAEYVSPAIWDHIDNAVFEPVAQALSVEAVGESVNVNSMDEVPDSAWFQNRIGVRDMSIDELKAAACKPEDLLPDEVADGEWVVDRGKTDGASFGFRVDIPGKGKYMLKTDQPLQPEQQNAAATIGAAIYHALGFNTTCEQVVYVRRAQLKLTPGLTSIDNRGITHPFGTEQLDAGLSATSSHNGRMRLTASKWLSGLTLGPFRYQGVRDDDPNDVIHHEHRRELRGGKIVAAWLNHWDAREQNSMDVWIASDAKKERSSPGFIRHYILDTSDVIGQAPAPPELARRMGHSYFFDARDFLFDLATLGIVERPWDRAEPPPGHEKFGYFSANDFDPANWKGAFPNPAFTRMTERDGAWMARIIARFTRRDLEAIVANAKFTNPKDGDYIVDTLMARRQTILARFLTRLSPISYVEPGADQKICAVDLARRHALFPAAQFRYEVSQIAGGARTSPAVEVLDDGKLCFAPTPSSVPASASDSDPARRVVFVVRNGTRAAPLEIHAYDLGARGLQIVGLRRPEP